MIIFCPWCEKTFGEKEPFEDKEKTSTICAVCKEKVLGRYLARFLFCGTKGGIENDRAGHISDCFVDVQPDCAFSGKEGQA